MILAMLNLIKLHVAYFHLQFLMKLNAFNANLVAKTVIMMMEAVMIYLTGFKVLKLMMLLVQL